MKPDFSAIKLVVFDVDGVLTDGRLYYGDAGEALKCFHVRDGVGIKLLQDNGIPVVVISAKSSMPLSKRMAELGVQHFMPGCHDKWSALQKVLEKLGLAAESVAYVGDDMIDLPVMKRVGVSLTPSDGYQLVRTQSDWVLATAGGYGVAREVADLVLGSQHDLQALYEQTTKPAFERKREH